MVPVWSTQCTHINTYIILVYSMDPGFIVVIPLCFVILDTEFCNQTQFFCFGSVNHHWALLYKNFKNRNKFAICIVGCKLVTYH